MTIEEIKNKYGNSNGYIPCPNCPIDAICNVDSGADGRDKCYARIKAHFDAIDEVDTEDIVNHPSHYTHGGMECIDEMIMVFGKQTVMHFCLCNAWKYRYRAIYKNGEEDIKKSHWYMAKYKELRDGNYQ